MQLNKTKSALSASRNGKLDMITNFNREVRTPLNALIGMSEQLSHTPLNKEQTELVHSIEHAAGVLLRIMNNAQEVYNLAKGDVRLDSQPFEIYAAFQAVTEGRQKAAFEKGLYFDAVYEGDRHLRVLGDEQRLKQVIQHLVENAIRYTTDGGIQVILRVSKAPEDKVLLHVEVHDTGMGIPETMLPHLFGYYSFARPPQMAAVSGAGLGLAIIQHILHLHGTNINVESTPGKGSIFSFGIVYPLSEAQTTVITRRELEDMTGSFMEGRNILVADDQEMNLLLLTRILSRWKCNFDKAADGIAAYELFSLNEYDMILLDVQMPGMTGLEVVKKIREDSDVIKSKVPVLAITSDITLTENSRYRNLGFNDCMLKPFRERDIYNTIIRHLPPEEVKIL
ncbi:ATP-binding protein [Chitinophaga sp.]|uniref:ATP-binding protein n=1 Tax=Chitinophaga sp. TaxID=1869181 RepID=UPI0031D6C605